MKFSNTSMTKLKTCDKRLQEIFSEVINHIDCTILTGHRTEVEQNEKFRQGLSKVQYPNSKHNHSPSLAVDVAPYPIDWNDRERFTYFAGIVQGIAISKGITLRWGGDWDRDTELRDNAFDDLVHFEIKGM